MSDRRAKQAIQRYAGELAHEPAAFDALFEHFHPRLVRFLSKMLEGTSVDPDDVAQESMVKAWTKRDHFDPRYQFSTWVYTIARRTAADQLRKQTYDQHTDQLDAIARTGESPEDAILADETTQDIWTTARRVLTTSQYLALWLRYGEEMTVKEVAKSLSKSSVSIRVLLHRARTALQPHLNPDGTATERRGETDQ